MACPPSVGDGYGVMKASAFNAFKLFTAKMLTNFSMDLILVLLSFTHACIHVKLHGTISMDRSSPYRDGGVLRGLRGRDYSCYNVVLDCNGGLLCSDASRMLTFDFTDEPY